MQPKRTGLPRGDQWDPWDPHGIPTGRSSPDSATDRPDLTTGRDRVIVARRTPVQSCCRCRGGTTNLLVGVFVCLQAHTTFQSSASSAHFCPAGIAPFPQDFRTFWPTFPQEPPPLFDLHRSPSVLLTGALPAQLRPPGGRVQRGLDLRERVSESDRVLLATAVDGGDQTEWD